MLWVEPVMSSLRRCVLPILGILLIIECIISLELMELRVPAHVPLGTRAQLSCRWQLGQDDVLYSVKWYKDGKEFFRHVPRDLEPRRKYPLPGVDVEISDASGGNLTLTPAVLATGGRYRCEVSGEKPLFPTVSDHADMVIYVLPDHGPVLTGFRARYRVGDRVKVNCTSGASRPATRLAWYINGEPAPAPATLPPVYEALDTKERTILTLDFIAQEKHFTRNGLKVKCLATLSPIYWRSNEESALMERTFHDRLRAVEEVRVTRADLLSNPGRKPSSSWRNIVAAIICSFRVRK